MVDYKHPLPHHIFTHPYINEEEAKGRVESTILFIGGIMPTVYLSGLRLTEPWWNTCKVKEAV
ncbi:MAG: hypothetical protein FWD92_02215 [Methanomassiliicoccaceae archaeon]|nr:hypothetical protein [Methanomassiliicoccaceae archaeon]